MNKYLRYLALLSLLFFSFYLTNNFSLYMRNNDPLYKHIMDVKDDYQEDYCNAVIEEQYMIPGVNGKELDVESTYRNMKKNGYFNTLDINYKKIIPTISAENHKDKIINRANPLKKAVAIITEDKYIKEYLENNKVYYTYLVNIKNYQENLSYGYKLIKDSSNYEKINSYLKPSLCYSTIDYQCKNKYMTLVQESYELANNNFFLKYYKVKSGDIILINDLNIKYLKILIDEIIFYNLEIMPLDKLVSEDY